MENYLVVGLGVMLTILALSIYGVVTINPFPKVTKPGTSCQDWRMVMESDVRCSLTSENSVGLTICPTKLCFCQYTDWKGREISTGKCFDTIPVSFTTTEVNNTLYAQYASSIAGIVVSGVYILCFMFFLIPH